MKEQIMEVVRQTVKIEIDVKAGSKYLVEKVIDPKLQEIVDKSSNSLDNVAYTMLMPEVKKEMIKYTGKVNAYVNGKIRKFLGYSDEQK